MTPRAYAAATRLSTDPGATPAERDAASRRCAEHEAKHGTVLRGTKNSLIDTVMRSVAERRAEHDEVVRQRAAQSRATQEKPIPWWELKVSPRGGPRHGKWMGNTAEFRAVLRGEKHGHSAIGDYAFCTYTGDRRTLEALDSGRVCWTHFPEHESASTRWRPPAEMRKQMRAQTN